MAKKAKYTKRKGVKRKRLRARRRRGVASGGTRGTSLRANNFHAFDPLPFTLRSTFRYVSYGTISTGTLQTVNQITYRMNSPYDPYYLAGGSSAQQWAVATSYYSFYQVHGCRVRVVFYDPSGDGVQVGVHAITSGYDALTSSTALDSVLASQNTRMKTIMNSGTQTATFNYKFKPWEWCCNSSIKYFSDDNYSAQVSAVPANDLALFQIFAINGNATNVTLNYTITIDYDTKLWGRL